VEGRVFFRSFGWEGRGEAGDKPLEEGQNCGTPVICLDTQSKVIRIGFLKKKGGGM